MSIQEMIDDARERLATRLDEAAKHEHQVLEVRFRALRDEHNRRFAELEDELRGL